jgi:pilus assembly protein CpaD
MRKHDNQHKINGRNRAITMAVSALAIALASGCASFKKDHVEVGAVPDDYRTNHPIILQEREEVLDLPVGTNDTKLSVNQRNAVNGVVSAYASGGSGPIRILAPSGSANEAAAGRIAHQIAEHLQKRGPSNGQVSLDYYQSSSNEVAPVRIAYQSMSAQTGKCGRWPEDILNSSENKHYANFGCSYQNNLAAQIANPADLLGPQGTGPIDAERRGVVIDDYRDGSLVLSPTTRF